MSRLLKCLAFGLAAALVPAVHAGDKPKHPPTGGKPAAAQPGNCFAGGYLRATGQLPANLVDKDGYMGVGTLRRMLGSPSQVIPGGVPANLPNRGRFIAIIGNDHCVYIDNGKASDFQIGRGYAPQPSLDAVRNTFYPNRPPAVQSPWKNQAVEIYLLPKP